MSNEITVSLSQTNPVTSVTVDGSSAGSIEIPQVAEIDVSAAAALQAGLPSLAVSAGTNITVDSSTGAFVISATVPEDIEDLSNVSGTPTVGQVLVWSGTAWQPTDESTGGTSNVADLNDLNDVSGIPSTGQVLVYSGSEWNPANPADVATSINDLTDVSGTPATGQVLVWSGTDYQPADAANQLVTTSGDLVLDPATGGVVVQGGTDGSGSITLNCEQNSHGLELKAPPHTAFTGNLSFQLPSTTGDQGQVLSTDGNGLMSWIDSSSQIEWVEQPLTSDSAGSAGQISYDNSGFFYLHDGTMWRRTQLSSFGIQAPVITIDSATPSDVDTTAGSIVAFSVTASVTQGLAPSYQWQLSSDSGTTFVDISGQVSSTLNVTPAISDNGNSYRCKVTADDAVDKISRAASLTVSDTAQLLTESGDDLQAENGDNIFHDGATTGTGTDTGGDTNEEKSLSITQHPQDIQGYTFEEWPQNISFSVAATASGGNPTYQWQKGYLDGDNDEWSDISGAVSSTLVYSMSLSESYEGKYFRCIISVGGIRGGVSNPATFRRVAGYVLGSPDIGSTTFADEYFTIQANYLQSSSFGSIIRGNYEVQATNIDASTGERDYSWDSIENPDRRAFSTFSSTTTENIDIFGDMGVAAGWDMEDNDRGSASLRFRTFDVVGGVRTEYGEWTYHGWGAILNPEDAVFFNGEATFEGDFAGKSYYTTALEGVNRHEVTAFQWQKKASGSSTWNDIPSENSKTLTITAGNNGDQFRLKGGAPGKTTVYTQAATLSVASGGDGGGTLGGTWTQIGNTIEGEAELDRSGSAVAISDDGNIVAIGATFNDGNGSGSGHVRVYSWNGSTWGQLGSDIDGESSGDESGWSVALSANGTILAIGARAANISSGGTNYLSAGKVLVFSWTGSTWSKIGSTLFDLNSEYFGHDVSLSSDGSILAVGANQTDGAGGLNAVRGRVKVYEYSSGSWTQLGSDITGESSADFSGNSGAISGDGSIVAIGAPHNDGNGSGSGHVRVYEYDSGSNQWTQLGADIDGEAAQDRFGWSVSLSDDGSIVAAGAYTNDGSAYQGGHVRVYEYDSGTWSQAGDDIDGQSIGEYNGWAVAISANGQTIAAGSRNGGSNTQGLVRVYGNSSSDIVQPPVSFQANPPGGSPSSLGMTVQTESTDCSVQILVDIPTDGTVTSNHTFLATFSGTGGHDDTGVYHTASLTASGNPLANQSVGASSGTTAGHWSFSFNPQGSSNSGNGNYNLSNNVVSYGSFSGGVASVSLSLGSQSTSFIFPSPSTIPSNVVDYTIQYKRVTSDGSDSSYSYWTTITTTQNTNASQSVNVGLQGGSYYKFRARANSTTQHSDWVEDSQIRLVSYVTHLGSVSGLSNAYCDDG